MTEFSFMLSDKDTDILFYLKEKQGFSTMTGNEFARRLLEMELHRMNRTEEQSTQYEHR